MDKLENKLVNLKNEYHENFKNVKNLDYKMKILYHNDFHRVLSQIVLYSCCTFLFVSLPIFRLVSKFITISSMISQLLITVCTVGMGVMIDRFFYKKFRYKDKLNAFSHAKTQEERVVESVRYEIESAKLKRRNSLIKAEYSCLKNLMNDPDAHLDMKDKNLEDISCNISKLTDELHHQHETIELLSIKRSIMKIYYDMVVMTMRSFLFQSILSIAFSLLFSYASLGFDNQLRSFLFSFFTCELLLSAYQSKRRDDYKEALDQINQELGGNAIDDFSRYGSKKDVLRKFDQELLRLVRKYAADRLELESKKRELESINAIEKEENKYSYHYTDAMDRSVDDDKTETEKKGYVHKRVKE